jgi:5-methyltetrahydropteroyltriglutamate--homocysteine methyltransferase
MTRAEDRLSETAAIRTTVVGSYPVPSWLGAAPTLPNLRDAVMVVLKTQELAGIDVVSDGELTRFDPSHPDTNGMIEYFVTRMAGVRAQLTREESARFAARPEMKFRNLPAGIVTGPLGEGTLDLPSAWSWARALSERPLKLTVTSPYMLAKTLVDDHYRDLRALARAIAEVLAAQVAAAAAPVVQVDEANLPGHPEDAGWAAEPINRVLGAAKGERGVHLCFGNYGGQPVQKGFWRDLLPFFNALEADHLVLETAHRDPGELEVLRGLKPCLHLGLGVIDIKSTVAETPDAVARTIERAAALLGAQRIRWVHPDCGFWMLPRSVADRKLVSLVQGRNLWLGRAS